jgi:hypothetical protein
MLRTLMSITVLGLALAFVGASAHPAAAGKGDKAERVKKKIRAARAMALVNALDLDETTATKLEVVLDKYDDDFAKLAKENIELRDKIDTASDDDMDKLVDDLVANQRARWDLDEARFKEVRKVLSARQAAKILVVLPEIDRKILAAVKRVIDGGPKGGKGKGKGKKKGRAEGKDVDTMEP